MINIVHELRLARGTNAKLRILQREANNEEWKQFLLAVYDSSINYYTSAPRDNTFTTEFNSCNFHDDLELLSERKYTGNAARAFSLQASRRHGELFRLALGGSLKAGVSVVTINKAYPGLIPTFGLMLAKDVKRVRYPIIASTKYDGVRLLAHVHMIGTIKRCTLYTRAGKEIYIQSIVHHMLKQPRGWYDGELVLGEGLQVGRSSITGQVNRCLKGTAIDIEGYSYFIFDWISEQEWADRECDTKYEHRMDFLASKFTPAHNIRRAPMIQVHRDEEVDSLYAKVLGQGYEGLILRYGKDPYTWDSNSNRSGKLIKRKATNEAILECIDVKEGTGKYEGMVGAIYCRGVIGDKTVYTWVGSGLTDHDRELPGDYYIGKKVELLYNDIVKAEKAVHHSLFLPRFKRVRGDYNV